MSSDKNASPTSKRRKAEVVILQDGAGRHYPLGDLEAVFKVDEDETGCAYSVSEWILEPGQPGVGAHSHDANDEIFYVLEGTPEFLTGRSWTKSSAGTFVRVPATVTNDFRNPGKTRARILNVFIPGGFGRNMPAISAWFANNSRRQ